MSCDREILRHYYVSVFLALPLYFTPLHLTIAKQSIIQWKMTVEIPQSFFLCDYVHLAPWLILGLLLLGGLNLPVSEDLVIILSGAMASVCIPEHTYSLYAWVFFCACLASWETYWIGRIYGPKLYNVRWFNRILPEHRIDKLHYYLERYGILVFIIIRFFPGGVRNALFLSSGLGKMPFWKYLLRDGVAALLSTSLLFYIGHYFGRNYRLILHYLKTYDEILVGFIIVLVVILLGIFLWHQNKSDQHPNKPQ